LGQDLGFKTFEFVGRDDSPVAQVGQAGQLVGLAPVAVGNVVRVPVPCRVLVRRGLSLVHPHFVTTEDQVQEDTYEREEDDQEQP
jgi:hypothetical protein